MSNNAKKLSKWQRFKIWASRSFGCTSSYTIKDNDLPPPVKAKEKQTTEEERKPPGKTNKVDTEITNVKAKGKCDLPERSFSKDSEDIPFMDASVVNIPQAVK